MGPINSEVKDALHSWNGNICCDGIHSCCYIDGALNCFKLLTWDGFCEEQGFIWKKEEKNNV